MLMPLALLLVSTAATATRPAPPHERVEKVTGQCGVVTVRSPQAPHIRTERFSAGQILDVEFGTALRKRVPGAHVLNLRVYTPKGHLYQQLSVAFDGGEAVGAAAAGASPKQPRLVARLPVGGTSITNASLFGRWKVVPHLDQSPRPCGAASVFTIAP